MHSINDPKSWARRQEPFTKQPVVLVQSNCGSHYAYAWELPEKGWEIYRPCYPVEHDEIIRQGERFAPTSGRTVPGYRLIADVRVAYA